MKARKAKKAFDCVAMKRAAQARIYARIKDLSPEDEIEYFQKAAETGSLGKRWKALRRKAQADRGARGRPKTKAS